MFRRTSSETPDSPVETPTTGKGRPTPSRKEAEAAARERAKLPRDRKALAKHQRQLRMESSRKLRAGMRAGDEDSLPPRDKGPVRRLVRDVVDRRLTFGDILLPLLMMILIFGYGAAGARAAEIANAAMLPVMLFAVVDMVGLRFRMLREVRRRFPEEPTKGLTTYAIMRALNMRWMRLPKARVKIGQPLPEHYR